MAPLKNIFAGTNNDMSVEKTSDIDCHLKVIKIAIIFLLCSLIASMGPLTYLLLHDTEIKDFESTFSSASELLSNSIAGSIDRKIAAGMLVDNLFGGAIASDQKQILPNFTLFNFENTMNALAISANCRYIAFAPLINTTTRLGWEAYAEKNVHKLNGPPSLVTSINGSWIVADGIYTISASGVRSYDLGYTGKDTPYPYWMFPVWQVAPVAQNSDLVMLDSLAVKIGGRQASIDEALTFRKPVFTSFVNLVQDLGTNIRPSTLIFSPIMSLADGNPIVGMFSSGFSWDVMLAGILYPEYKEVNCVITSTDSKCTIFLFTIMCDTELTL